LRYSVSLAVDIILTSACLPACDAVYCGIQYILQQKCLNKWIGTALYQQDFTTFNHLHWSYLLKLPTPRISKLYFFY